MKTKASWSLLLWAFLISFLVGWSSGIGILAGTLHTSFAQAALLSGQRSLWAGAICSLSALAFLEFGLRRAVGVRIKNRFGNSEERIFKGLLQEYNEDGPDAMGGREMALILLFLEKLNFGTREETGFECWNCDGPLYLYPGKGLICQTCEPTLFSAP
jgi:hypothetical protein